MHLPRTGSTFKKSNIRNKYLKRKTLLTKEKKFHLNYSCYLNGLHNGITVQFLTYLSKKLDVKSFKKVEGKD